MKQSIITFAVIFIISFICFNQGMNSIFENYKITVSNIMMVVLPIIAVTMFIVNEVLKSIDNNVKPE
jgi:magnesium-transporting ATPase (P-type)